MSTPIPFCWRRRVAMCEVDALAVVWHGHYLAYCDEARAELLRAFGLAPAALFERGYVAPVIEAHCRFVAPARFDDELEIAVTLRQDRGTRLCFDFVIQRAMGRVRLAEITTTQVLAKTNGDLVYLMPPEIQRVLERIHEAQGEAPTMEA